MPVQQLVVIQYYEIFIFLYFILNCFHLTRGFEQRSLRRASNIIWNSSSALSLRKRFSMIIRIIFYSFNRP